MQGLAEELGEADEGEEAAEGEEGVRFPDACDVQEAEGGEKDKGAEPCGKAVATKSEPTVKKGDERDTGERGAEPGGELRHTEEFVEEGGNPKGEGRFLEP